jgi:hypothetical protein
MLRKRKKTIAVFLLVVMTAQLAAPLRAFALTSGPAQPEMSKFEPAGATDLVDLFTGDMKYNIPLMDVGGYPVNLSYHSGEGIEDEASWVGMGWGLNPGAVNRQMRGLPDDFDGSRPNAEGDKIQKTYSRKEFKKTGGALNVKTTLFGWEKGKASVELNVYKDNYYGMGASIGAGIDFSLSLNTKTSLNAGLNLLSDARGGVDISPNVGLSMHSEWCQDLNRGSLSGGFTYNSRSGLKDVSLSASFNPSKVNNYLTISSSAVKYFGQTYTPSITSSTTNSGFTFTFDAGGLFAGGYGGGGGKGYTYHEKILDKNTSARAYGYLNYLKGRNDQNGLIDFNREKDGVFIKGTPAIGLPVSTQDYFNVTAQTGSQQFRPYFGGNYIVFDKAFTNTTNNTTLGLTTGGGSIIQFGGNFSYTSGAASTNKWINGNNAYLNVGQTNFLPSSNEESIYFKQIGEKGSQPGQTQDITGSYYPKIGGEKTSQVNLTAGGATEARLKFRDNSTQPLGPIKREQREKRNYAFTYLDARQASKYGLDRSIATDEVNTEPRFNDANGLRKPHHISEITVTDNEGKRMVYGIPVYNRFQEDISFAVKKPAGKEAEVTQPYYKARKTGVIDYVPGTDDGPNNQNGRDWLYSKERVPGYATSYLLTGILSPDYVDKKKDGITDDDNGTAVKFNYTKRPNFYKWRAPYGENKANYNEGFLSDPLDDKASIVYGEKEIWYLRSIESKTMIAVFHASAREDGLGVEGQTGKKYDGFRLMKLDSVKLYSKAEYLKAKKDGDLSLATAIKTVHFEYDYSLVPGVPNNSGAQILDKDGNDLNIAKGKLTLKKVYFTFGKNERGKSNPYEFEYKTDLLNFTPANPIENEKIDQYDTRQTDRWGTYKQSFYNRISGNTGVLNNSEFPYVPQENENTPYSEREMADRLAAKWQLTKIKTPSSGIISVQYEADDYAYVQDRKAMQMCFVTGIENPGQSGDLSKPDNRNQSVKRLVIQLPKLLKSQCESGCNQNDCNSVTCRKRRDEFRDTYLSMGNGKYHDNIFYKILTDLNNTGKYEYVYGYAEIDLDQSDFCCSHPDYVKLALKPIKPEKVDSYYSPIAIQAWQMLRTDLPQYAYDNYDNLEVGDGVGAIRAIVQAAKNIISELDKPFEAKADKKHFGGKIDLQKSMVRLTNPDGKKIGGGCRVKRVDITDDWSNMVPGATSASYGQEYNYEIKNDQGIAISSGVASYEPEIGNEENPFHEPINFTEKVHWGNDKNHFIQKPFCESYFPAASVGYSKVTVTSFGEANAKETGYVENEFYTARDFPTLVDYLPLDPRPYENSMIVKLFSSRSVDKMAVSQGFKIELNDMHGKPKTVKVYNKGGDLLSSSEYIYNVTDEKAEQKQLNNVVNVLNDNGTYQPKQLATDIDFITDVRESVSTNDGNTVGVSGGVTLIPPFPIFFIPPFPIPIVALNMSHSSFISSYHSVSSVKVVHKFGLIKKVITTQNGSTVEAENLLWDGETGEVLLTQTQNEFDKYTYSFNYPAHMVAEYEGMDAAYKNLGITFENFTTDANGRITSLSTQQQADYLFPGDELVALGIDRKGWIIQSSDNSYRLVDDKGEFIVTSGSWMIYRAGRRNLLTTGVGSVVMMKNPMESGQVNLDITKRILDAKAVVFKQLWSVPVNNIPKQLIPPAYVGWIPNDDNFTNFMKVLYTNNPATGRCYIFSYKNENVSVGNIIRRGLQLGIFSAATDPLHTFFTNCTSSSYPPPNVDQVHYYLEEDPVNGNGLNQGDQAVFEIDNYTIDVVKFETLPPGVVTFLSNPNRVGGMTYYNQNIDPGCSKAALFTPPGSVNCYPAGATATAAAPSSTGAPNYKTSSTSSTLAVGCYTYTGIYALNPDDAGIQCTNPVDQVFNPYFQGVLGNWRPYTNYVYTVNREQKPGNAIQVGGTDIRNSGYYADYSPFWNWQGNALSRTFEDNTTLPLTDPRSRWIWSNRSVYYDQKGNEIESVDALYRYGTALFGYQQSLAIAVGANSRHNEIAFDGFEDYNFNLQDVSASDCPLAGHFNFGFVRQGNEWVNSGGRIVANRSHTGKYCYELSSTFATTRASGSALPSEPVFGYDVPGRYLLKANELAKGFAPIPGKEYILSLWINDNQPTVNKVQGFDVYINGLPYQKIVNATTYRVSDLVVPVVEGWKLLELRFTPGSDFSLQLVPLGGGSKYIDDLRIFPANGQMNSYVYDDQKLRLMAQLDENNFATLYEYDDEGTPIRVKKETERGLMTLRESRQSLRKH